MFRKLLKYEWRANAQLFWILSLASLGVALLGGGVLRMATYIGETTDQMMVVALVVPGMYLMAGFCALALVAYSAAVHIVNLVCFAKNKFTDQGYLTFTLPVKAGHIFLSAAVNMLLWMLISLVVTVLCFGLMLSLGLGNVVRRLLEEDLLDLIFSISLWEILEGLNAEMSALPGYGLNVALNIVKVVLSPLQMVVMPMSCITLGCVLAKKYKILASIGVYYGCSMVVNVIFSTVSSLSSLLLTEVENLYLVGNIVTAFEIVLQLAIIVGGYFLSVHLMKHKLNLP